MGRIKSAWEIALEKTENLSVDLDKIKKDKAINLGRRICGSYINDIDYTMEKFKTEFEESPDKKATKEGILNIILLNLSLPSDRTFENSLDKINDIIDYLKEDSSELTSTVSQLKEFFEQYLNHQEQLVNQMQEQFAPALKQKEAQLQAQYGPSFTYTADQDDEFMQMLSNNLKKLNEQYNETLDSIKEKVKEELS